MSVPNYTLSTVATPGGEALGVCYDGTLVWITDVTASAVYIYNPVNSLLVNTIALTSAPGACCYDGQGSVWAITHDGGGNDFVVKIDVATQTVVAYYPTGNNAGSQFGICADATHIWVTEANNDTVCKILIATGAVIGHYATDNAPGTCCVEGANIWIVCQLTVTKILAATGATLGSFAITSGGQGILFDGTDMWVSCLGNLGNAFTPELVKMDTAGTILISTPIAVAPPTANGPFLAAILFDGTYIYVVDSEGNNGDNTVFLVDPATNTVLASFDLAVNANSVFAVFAGSNIWAANSNFGSISVLTLVVPTPSNYQPIIDPRNLPWRQMPFCIAACHCCKDKGN